MDGDSERLTFIGRKLPQGFAARHVAIDPGCERPYESTEWSDALVVVEAGELELECIGGTRARFDGGAVLFLDSLPLRTLRNCGRESLLLIAVSRDRPVALALGGLIRHTDESAPLPASHKCRMHVAELAPQSREGVDGSSPSEGFRKPLHRGLFSQLWLSCEQTLGTRGYLRVTRAFARPSGRKVGVPDLDPVLATADRLVRNDE